MENNHRTKANMVGCGPLASGAVHGFRFFGGYPVFWLGFLFFGCSPGFLYFF
jgi:hypothetical protein